MTLTSDGPQYLQALALANRVRFARAELKRRISAGEIAAADIILACPWEAHSMAIGDLLVSQRRWGATRCRRFLSVLPMSENKTIGSMTERQRHTLAARLRAAPSPVPVVAATAGPGLPIAVAAVLPSAPAARPLSSPRPIPGRSMPTRRPHAALEPALA
jgi:hypothetical protein